MYLRGLVSRPTECRYSHGIAARSSPCQGWGMGGVSTAMLLAILLALQTAPAREAPPVLLFPAPGLDDLAAYGGYSARVYRDARGNSVEIYIEGKTGRVVHMWADALNESIGFTLRDAGGQEPTTAVAFDSGGATVGATGGRRWLRYPLTVQGGRSIRSEEHTSELQSRLHLVCRLLLEKKKKH